MHPPVAVHGGAQQRRHRVHVLDQPGNPVLGQLRHCVWLGLVSEQVPCARQVPQRMVKVGTVPTVVLRVGVLGKGSTHEVGLKSCLRRGLLQRPSDDERPVCAKNTPCGLVVDLKLSLGWLDVNVVDVDAGTVETPL